MFTLNLIKPFKIRTELRSDRKQKVLHESFATKPKPESTTDETSKDSTAVQQNGPQNTQVPVYVS